MEIEKTVTPANTHSTSLPRVKELFAGAWGIFKKDSINLTVLSFLSMLAATIPLYIGTIITKMAVTGTGATVLGFVLGLISLVLMLWGQVALLWMIKSHEQHLSIKEAYTQSYSKIIPYLGVVFLSALITMGGMILFIIPGIVLTVWFSLAIFIVICDEEKGFNALLKSMEYVRGNWWQFFRYLASMILFAICLSLVGIIFQSVTNKTVGEFVGNIVSIFATPVLLSYSYLVYLSAKAHKPNLLFVPSTKKKVVFSLIAIFGIAVFAGFALFIATTPFS